MKVLVQRVKKAECLVDGTSHARIGRGLLLFVSFREGDEKDLIPQMAKKVADLRIFEDEEGKMNHSVKDLDLEILSISQFTLEADTRKGNRPSFTKAKAPQEAELHFHAFGEALEAEGLTIYEGVFGARMEISLVNDGPVTILLEKGSGRR